MEEATQITSAKNIPDTQLKDIHPTEGSLRNKISQLNTLYNIFFKNNFQVLYHANAKV